MPRGINDYDIAELQGRNVANSNSLNIVSPGLITDGLVMHLDAGNYVSYPTSGATWFDVSGNRLNGTLISSPLYGRDGLGSFYTDGFSGYVTSTFATTSGQALTYCGWLYSTATNNYRNFVDSNSANPMIWWNGSGQIEFDGGGTAVTTTTVYRNQWTYVCLSKPSGNTLASYYVNGEVVSGGSAYTVGAVTPTWVNRGGTSVWLGYFAIFKAYNRNLSTEEIRQNFNATRARFGV